MSGNPGSLGTPPTNAFTNPQNFTSDFGLIGTFELSVRESCGFELENASKLKSSGRTEAYAYPSAIEPWPTSF